MTRFDDLDRNLASFFDSEAAAPAPDGLLELVISATARRHPRPGWQARLRFASMPLAPARRSVSRAVLIAVALILALAAAILVGGQLTQGPRPLLERFEQTGLLPDKTAHFASSARTIDGRVVLAGGIGDVSLYDPALGTFVAVSVPELYSYAAIGAPDGSVLLFGQDIRDSNATPGISVVRLDGQTGIASPIIASSIAFADVAAESAFLGLRDGRVLIVGQAIAGPARGSLATLFYDPRMATFAPGPASVAMRAPARAVGLADGRILLVEASDVDGPKPQALAILDPVRGTIAPAGAIDTRDGHTMTTLADGRVLIAGGVALIAGGVATSAGGSDQRVLDTAWLVDPRGPTVTVSQTGRLPEGRWMHGAALLQDGRVLLVGGDLAPATPFAPTTSTLFFRPATNDFAAGPSMVMARIAPKVVPLTDGRVLVAGHYGMVPNAATTGAELTAEVFR